MDITAQKNPTVVHRRKVCRLMCTRAFIHHGKEETQEVKVKEEKTIGIGFKQDRCGMET